MAYDKKMHLLICLGLSLVGSLSCYPGIGFGVAMTWGVGKEVVWDWALKKGTPEWGDLGADVAGAVIGEVVAQCIRYLT